MQLVTFFKNLLDSLLSGSFERMRIVNGMNDAFKEYYYSGELQRLCKVTITPGDSSYRHEMSSMVFRSGFKINILNDNNLKESEIIEISKYILSNTPFIRQLMSIGFDTLLIKGKTTLMGQKYALKNYANLNSYFIER